MKWEILNEMVSEVIDKPHARNFHHSKLTEKDVRQIKTLEGVISGVEIGRIFGVDKSTVCNIFKGKYWKYVK